MIKRFLSYSALSFLDGALLQLIGYKLFPRFFYFFGAVCFLYVIVSYISIRRLQKRIDTFSRAILRCNIDKTNRNLYYYLHEHNFLCRTIHTLLKHNSPYFQKHHLELTNELNFIEELIRDEV